MNGSPGLAAVVARLRRPSCAAYRCFWPVDKPGDFCCVHELEVAVCMRELEYELPAFLAEHADSGD